MVGRLHVLPLVGLFVMLSLAGCLGDGKGGGASVDEGDDTGGDGAGEAVFTQSTGAVTGYVLDVAFGSIAGATVSLTKDGAASQNATSDATGAYSLSEIEPGSYLLFANKTGYRPKSKPVTITEGTLLREQFLLEEAPTVTPFIEGPIEFKGFLECSSAPPNGKCTQSGAEQLPGNDNHHPSSNYAIKEGLQAILFEMVWSTSRGTGANDGGAGGSGGGMSLATSWDSNDNDGAASASGVNGDRLLVYLERRLNADGKWKVQCVEGCTEARDEIADWPMTAGGVVAYNGQPDAINVVVQRPFEIYVTAFYHQMKPTGFTGEPET
jgi:hypothetical protein